MSLESLTIKNKLEVIGAGIEGVIRVPGCEPTTALSSTALLANVECPVSTVSVRAVLEGIPGTTLVRIPNFGSVPKYFLVLPEGPPPNAECPSTCIPDYYQLIRDIADEQEPEEGETRDLNEECQSFSYTNCPSGIGDVTGPKFK